MYLKRRYGLTVSDYQTLLTLGSGRCWICLRLPGRRRLSVDHDHKIGHGKKEAVRGLLCFKCNLGLQRFNDDPARLHRAGDYLERKLPFLQPREKKEEDA